MNYIFLLPRHPTSWHELYALAKRMETTQSFKPIMVLANAYASSMSGLCKSDGIVFLDVFKDIQNAMRKKERKLFSFLEKFELWCQTHESWGVTLPLSLLRLLHMRRQLKAEYNIFLSLFQSYNPCLVLMPGDRELSPVPAMLKLCLEQNIPAIIATATVPESAGIAQLRQNKRSFKTRLHDRAPVLNWLTAYFFPKQVRETDYGALLFSPGWRFWALKSLGMHIDNPWIQGGGNSTYILQTSPERLERSLRQGVKPEKCLMTGDHTLDQVYHNMVRRQDLRQQLNERYGLSLAKPLIAVAVPNDAEHNICDWASHTQRMRTYLGRLKREDTNTLLALHPKSRKEDYQFLSEDFGLIIAQDQLVDILPASDIFVCSYSTTVIWSRLCGIPTINLHYFNLVVDDFNDPINVKDAVTPEDVDQSVEYFLSLYHNGEIQHIQAHAARLRRANYFDGKSFERLIDLFKKISQGERPAGPYIIHSFSQIDDISCTQQSSSLPV